MHSKIQSKERYDMKKETKINRFVWIDCEMTGLDVAKDVLLEIATIITDTNLDIIAEGPNIIIHQHSEHLEAMIPFVKELHKESGLIDEVSRSTISLQDAQDQTLALIVQHCKAQEAVLAGNSVWQDAMFLRKYMPQVIDYLNYRLLDVSAIKLVIKQWYAQDPCVNFKKAETHRALADIRESINELKHYREHFFKPNQQY